MTLPFAKGVQRERESFEKLRATTESKSLRHLFFAERNAQKVSGIAGAKARRLERVAVIGAGTMGAGTAVRAAMAGCAAAGALGAGQPRGSATLAAGAVASVVSSTNPSPNAASRSETIEPRSLARP